MSQGRTTVGGGWTRPLPQWKDALPSRTHGEEPTWDRRSSHGSATERDLLEHRGLSEAVIQTVQSTRM